MEMCCFHIYTEKQDTNELETFKKLFSEGKRRQKINKKRKKTRKRIKRKGK